MRLCCMIGSILSKKEMTLRDKIITWFETNDDLFCFIMKQFDLFADASDVLNTF